MQKSAARLADPLPHVRQHNGTSAEAAETSSNPLIGWYKELVSLIPKQTRKTVRKTIRKAVRKHGPEIATAIATGVLTSLLTTATGKKKKKKKKKK
jgi:hypothetical protein